jgi:DNA (cytosine-5)-methyltransferase 1
LQAINEIIVDNFAGGGGVSLGIEWATGRIVDIAINHDKKAIAMHKVNHPHTKHYCEDVWQVDPVEAAAGRPVGLAWFSPDCTHHSKARGGKPKDKNIRGLAWVAVKWAKKVKPRVIILENVEEFQDWGPLTEDNQPDPKRKGETFQLFVKALRRLGYKVEWRELRACDYGAPTIRKRFFLIARCDGKPIVWPQSTHGDPDSLEVRCGLLKPWRTAAEIIDWSLPCPSIFESTTVIKAKYGVKSVRPLADNTLRRVAKGIDRFVLKNSDPFIVQVNHSGAKHHYCSDIHGPLATVTAKHGFGVVTPVLAQLGHTGGGDRQHGIEEPLSTIVSKAEHMLVTPMLLQYHSETSDREVRGQSIDQPIMTIDSSPRYALATVNLCVLRNNMDGKSLDEPISTIMTSPGHFAQQINFLSEYYGQGLGQQIDAPIHTIVSKDKFGVVTVKIEKINTSQDLGHWPKVRELLNKFCDYKLADDEILILYIDGIAYFICDVGLRMLVPRELFNGNGFPPDYIIEYDDKGNPYPKSEQVARCGNAVPPQLPMVLVRANLPELCGIEPLERGQIS